MSGREKSGGKKKKKGAEGEKKTNASDSIPAAEGAGSPTVGAPFLLQLLDLLQAEPGAFVDPEISQNFLHSLCVRVLHGWGKEQQMVPGFWFFFFFFLLLLVSGGRSGEPPPQPPQRLALSPTAPVLSP